MAARDLTGQTFERLTVLQRMERRAKQARWLCRCECGAEKVVWQSSLVRGEAKSCGCLLAEYRARKTRPRGNAVNEEAMAVKQRQVYLREAGVADSAMEQARRAWR